MCGNSYRTLVCGYAQNPKAFYLPSKSTYLKRGDRDTL